MGIMQELQWVENEWRNALDRICSSSTIGQCAPMILNQLIHEGYDVVVIVLRYTFRDGPVNWDQAGEIINGVVRGTVGQILMNARDPAAEQFRAQIQYVNEVLNITNPPQQQQGMIPQHTQYNAPPPSSRPVVGIPNGIAMVAPPSGMQGGMAPTGLASQINVSKQENPMNVNDHIRVPVAKVHNVNITNPPPSAATPQPAPEPIKPVVPLPDVEVKIRESVEGIGDVLSRAPVKPIIALYAQDKPYAKLKEDDDPHVHIANMVELLTNSKTFEIFDELEELTSIKRLPLWYDRFITNAIVKIVTHRLQIENFDIPSYVECRDELKEYLVELGHWETLSEILVGLLKGLRFYCIKDVLLFSTKTLNVSLPGAIGFNMESRTVWSDTYEQEEIDSALNKAFKRAPSYISHLTLVDSVGTIVTVYRNGYKLDTPCVYSYYYH